MECEFPSVDSSSEEIGEIFKKTKTIAIIGLSPNEEKDSNKVARYLQSAGFKIIPVYPKEETILGEKVYRDLDDITEKIDLVDVFRKPDYIPTVVEKMLKRDDVKTLWTQKGIVNNEAAEVAKKAGLNVVQNHCTMVEHKRVVNG
jgi:uncharacterized protein